MDRKTVADKVLERLQWAEQNIGNSTSQDGDNTINQDCVRAVISRFGLREGTWRKYHELGDAEKYLQECVRASRVINGRLSYSLHGNRLVNPVPDMVKCGQQRIWDKFQVSFSINLM